MLIRRNPSVYEINTWVWLTDLSSRFERTVTLGDVPSEALDEIAAWSPDVVWMMGVWQRSPHGRAIALSHPDLQFEYQRVLPNFRDEDIVGSPYAVYRYVVDGHLGGPDGLAAFREQLQQRGIALLLDYVPNHVAVDHHWTVDCPDCLVRGTEEDLALRSSFYFHTAENNLIFAHGRDPYYPPWTDTAQVNAFSPDARAQSLATVQSIANQCDGVRCDMSMLLVNRIFSNLWNMESPHTEFWHDLIPAVKEEHPGFVFMAEVYWEMEAELQSLGFDYTYDKRLYDRLLHESVHIVRDHLYAASTYQRRMVRFIENHDERRAQESFGYERSMAAAALTMLLPGAKLYYDGQFEGRRIKLPVQLGVRPKETPNEPLKTFYAKVTAELSHAVYHDGTFMMLGTQPILSHDESHENLFAFAWALDDEWRVTVVNYSDREAKGRIMLPRPSMAGMTTWIFTDALNPENALLYGGDDLLTSGLPIDLPAYGAYLFAVSKG
ncbi:MAG: alpha-amylase family glycosyl hydrolase [Chloroflexota bacterium]